MTPPDLPPPSALVDCNLLLLQNKAWAQTMLARDARYFTRMAEAQSPKFLWIGCADSRVGAGAITGTEPGEIFVHRNIANVVVHSDLNALSVLTYAVEVLKVEHVIVCGHHGCGGVRAAMTAKDQGVLNKWLLHIKEVYARHYEELQKIADPIERENRLCELNAIAQLQNLAKSSIIQRAWKQRRAPYLHAWVYDLGDGILHELAVLAPDTVISPPFRFELPQEA